MKNRICTFLTSETQSAGAYFVVIVILLGLLFLKIHPRLEGDIDEYAVMTIAFAEHASPDIRITDLVKAKELLPQFAIYFNSNIEGMQANADIPKPGFYRGHDSNYYAIHYFAFSALSAIPFKALEIFNFYPFHCFLLLNLIFLLILFISIYKLYLSFWKALYGTMLFMLCGGALYISLSSPEFMTASSLLSSIILFTIEEPIAAGILGGIASMQNPSVVFMFGFIPILKTCANYKSFSSCIHSFKKLPKLNVILGIGLGVLLFTTAIIFNFYEFGTPSIIAKVSTDPSLMSLNRLRSFYFDFNQGMIICIPGIILWIIIWGWRAEKGQQVALIVTSILLTTLFVLPALSVHNWNSGCVGVMRYVFWSSMPIVFVFMLYLKKLSQWPLKMVTFLTIIQFIAMMNAYNYPYLEFSPLSKLMFKLTPSLYNPAPEIYVERLTHSEGMLDINKIYPYTVDGVVKKVMYNTVSSLKINSVLCKDNQIIDPRTPITDTDQNWRFISGPIKCVPPG